MTENNFTIMHDMTTFQFYLQNLYLEELVLLESAPVILEQQIHLLLLIVSNAAIGLIYA